MLNVRVSLMMAAVVFAGFSSASLADDGWQAGTGRVVITPEKPMFASGYGGRNKPSEGKVHDLYARSLALRDPAGETAVFIALDLIGVPVRMVRVVAPAIEQEHGIPRRSLMFACSHTHCGPALDDMLSHMLDMKESDWEQIRAYQQQLNASVIKVINQAVGSLKPARLSVANGVCQFASNRRSPKGLGPYDHQVPVLKVESPDGSQLRGLVFGYACHNTTLSFYQWCGDYAGFAQLYLEDRHPGCTAMFFTGCGADQNPLPRRRVELAAKYGRMLGIAVDEVLDKPMQVVKGELRTSFQEIDLEFNQLPTREQLEANRKSSSRYERQRAGVLLSLWDANGGLAKTYPYPIQAWRLGGQIDWVALGGEVVVDYQIRLRRELGRSSTWVTGYANDVMAYIPSERVLQEGGYEGDTSMIVYQQPSKWKAGLEDQIVSTVRSMVETNRGQK